MAEFFDFIENIFKEIYNLVISILEKAGVLEPSED